MKKTEFGNKTGFMGPYNSNNFLGGNKNRCKWTTAFKMTWNTYIIAMMQ